MDESINHSIVIDSDDPDIVFIEWVVGLLFKSIGKMDEMPKITPESIYDVGIMKLVKDAIDNAASFNLTLDESVYLANRYYCLQLQHFLDSLE